MKTSSAPSVLVVRSTCLSDSQERSVQTPNDDDTTAMTTMLQQTLQSLPVTCDIVVIPEIPVFSEMSTNDKKRRNDKDDMTTNHKVSSLSTSLQDDIRKDRQQLHPCGMDNVLLLRNLPPAADPAGYLLGLLSCEMIVSHVESPSGIMMELERPVHVPVQAVPSTFSFAFNKDSLHSSSKHGVVVNPRSASAELHVVFDFGGATERLEGIVQKQYLMTASIMDDTEASSLVDNDVNFVAMEEETQTVCDSTVNENVVISRNVPIRHNDELLHVIRELAEKEAQHLDYMLVALGLVFCLLLVHYARTVMPLIRSKQTSTKSRKNVRLSSVAERTEEDVGTKGNRPPVNSVMFHRSVSKDIAVQEQQATLPTGNGVVGSPSSKTPFVASESTIGMAETSSLSSASAREMKHFTFLPSPKKNVWDKENMPAGGKELSPCSKLAQRWMQTKGQRRMSRKAEMAGPHHVISPVLSPLQVPSNTENIRVETKTKMAPPEIEIPSLTCEPIMKVSAIADTEESPGIVSVGAKPLTPATLANEESFLQDYWGE